MNDSNEDGSGEVLSPISDLCEALKACSLHDNMFTSPEQKRKRKKLMSLFKS